MATFISVLIGIAYAPDSGMQNQPNMRIINGVHHQCIQGAEYVASIGRDRSSNDYPIWQPILIKGSPKKCTY